MSSSSSGPIRITDVSVFLTSKAKQAKRLTSGTLHVGAKKYKLICNDGTLSQELGDNVEISPDTPVSLSYRRMWQPRKTTERIDARHIFESFSREQKLELLVSQGDISIVFKHQPLEKSSSAPHSNGTLPPTTEAILDDCSRFRILVIGRTGVGKSTLINIAFGIEETSSAHLKRGKANIDDGLESPVNKRFILHDSLGFEPGDKDNYDTVKRFIQDRQKGPLKDQLHAVWFCVKAPHAGDRLLEVAAEDFFHSMKMTMGSIPLIVVFTKFDSLMDEQTIRMTTANRDNLSEEGITAQARVEASFIVKTGYEEISRHAGKPLPHAIVSTRKDYKYTIQELIEVTHHQVGISDAPDAQVTSAVTLMAQRIDPTLKIHGSIDVGKQRYWKALKTSPDFTGRKIWDCLSVIHTDIVSVWNFNDPSCYLFDQEFKALVIDMVKQVPIHPATNLVTAIGILNSGESLTSAVSSYMNKLPQTAAAVIVPVAAALGASAWAYEVFRNMKNMRQIFMAFIVDLTHIMETLFILTARDHNKLTRRAIKIAYHTYMECDVMRQAHAYIQTYNESDGLGPLEMIEALIRPEKSGTSHMREYYAGVGTLDLRKLCLNQEEDWIVAS